MSRGCVGELSGNLSIRFGILGWVRRVIGFKKAVAMPLLTLFGFQRWVQRSRGGAI